MRSLCGSADVKKGKPTGIIAVPRPAGCALLSQQEGTVLVLQASGLRNCSLKKQEKKAKEDRQDEKPGGEAEERQIAVGHNLIHLVSTRLNLPSGVQRALSLFIAVPGRVKRFAPQPPPHLQ